MHTIKTILYFTICNDSCIRKIVVGSNHVCIFALSQSTEQKPIAIFDVLQLIEFTRRKKNAEILAIFFIHTYMTTATTKKQWFTTRRFFFTAYSTFDCPYPCFRAVYTVNSFEFMTPFHYHSRLTADRYKFDSMSVLICTSFILHAYTSHLHDIHKLIFTYRSIRSQCCRISILLSNENKMKIRNQI